MKMESKNSHSFFNGFVIGLIVGVGVALLFTTKKGKKILKSLSEEGLESVNGLDDLLQKFESATKRVTHQNEDDDTEEKESDYVRERPALLAHDGAELPVAKKIALPKVEINEDDEEDQITKSKPTRRRFFRGIPKRG